MRMKLAKIRDHIVCVNKYLMGTWWPVMPKIVHLSGSIGVSRICLPCGGLYHPIEIRSLLTYGESLRKPYQRTSWKVVLPCLHKQTGETQDHQMMNVYFLSLIPNGAGGFR